MRGSQGLGGGYSIAHWKKAALFKYFFFKRREISHLFFIVCMTFSGDLAAWIQQDSPEFLMITCMKWYIQKFSHLSITFCSALWQWLKKYSRKGAILKCIFYNNDKTAATTAAKMLASWNPDDLINSYFVLQIPTPFFMLQTLTKQMKTYLIFCYRFFWGGVSLDDICEFLPSLYTVKFRIY